MHYGNIRGNENPLNRYGDPLVPGISDTEAKKREKSLDELHRNDPAQYKRVILEHTVARQKRQEADRLARVESENAIRVMLKDLDDSSRKKELGDVPLVYENLVEDNPDATVADLKQALGRYLETIDFDKKELELSLSAPRQGYSDKDFEGLSDAEWSQKRKEQLKDAETLQKEVRVGLQYLRDRADPVRALLIDLNTAVLDDDITIVEYRKKIDS